MHSLISRKFLVSIALLGFVMAGTAQAEDLCPESMLPGYPEGSTPATVLDDEFGPDTSAKTTCLSKREDVKIVMQLNKSCRDSIATHPIGNNGKATGDSKVVNNVANCAGNRAYALGNLSNMIKDLTITNGIPSDEIDIRVVVHSGGGYVLLKDAGYDGDGNYIEGRNKFESQVEDLMNGDIQGVKVKFFFCQNTTRGFIRNGTLPAGDATAQLIDGVEYVTAGVTAISDLQEQGYRYVQP